MTNKYYIRKDSQFFLLQIAILLALLTSLSPFATDTYMPALPVMAEYFQKPLNLLQISLTVYFAGVAVGQLFGGPFSDSYGRKKVAIFGLLLFSGSSILATFVTNIYFLWALRFLQAIGGGCASVVNMAFVRDWFEGKEVARISSLMGMIMMFAPLVAPVIGSFLLIHFGWQSIFLFMFVVSIVTLFLFLIFVPESRDPKLITNRITLSQITKSYHTIFTSGKTLFLVLTNSFSIAGMFAFLTAASFIYIDFFNIEVSKFPLFFGANIVLNISFNLLNFRLVKKFNPVKLLQVGLIIQSISGIFLLVGTLQNEPNLWWVFISIAVNIGSLGLTFANSIALIINRFPKISGSANAVIGVLRFALSAIIGSAIAYFHNGTLVPTGIFMFGCAAIALILFHLSNAKH